MILELLLMAQLNSSDPISMEALPLYDGTQDLQLKPAYPAEIRITPERYFASLALMGLLCNREPMNPVRRQETVKEALEIGKEMVRQIEEEEKIIGDSLPQ